VREFSNENVPTAAVISHFVVNEALERNITLTAASQNVLPRFRLAASGPFFPPQIRLLSHLYCLLVFPAEIWKRRDLLDIVLERAKEDPDLLHQNKGLLTKDAIRSLRNATSHARIFFEGEKVTLQDQRGNAPPHFSHAMSISEATNFLLVLGRAFHESQQVQDQLTKNTRPQ